MAYTQEDLTELKKAIATGALVVWYGDKRVEYRSLNEMLKTVEIMENALTGTKKKRTRIYTFGAKSSDR